MTKFTHTVTHKDGSRSVRKSDTAYTHAVVVTDDLARDLARAEDSLVAARPLGYASEIALLEDRVATLSADIASGGRFRYRAVAFAIRADLAAKRLHKFGPSAVVVPVDAA